jgi:hypothetical protein
MGKTRTTKKAPAAPAKRRTTRKTDLAKQANGSIPPVETAAPKMKPRTAAKARSAKVPGAKRTTARKTTAKSRSAAVQSSFTSEDVALRAYFIAQCRHAEGAPGTPEGDWLEAERQLRVEYGL